ncbi:MAG: hypothetical protein J2P54_05430 [Bradyrhizobiaceae bacterium]|nr:hypothetical protein [Bradyrhizobiaceae bacterium]
MASTKALLNRPFIVPKMIFLGWPDKRRYHGERLPDLAMMVVVPCAALSISREK